MTYPMPLHSFALVHFVFVDMGYGLCSCSGRGGVKYSKHWRGQDVVERVQKAGAENHPKLFHWTFRSSTVRSVRVYNCV